MSHSVDVHEAMPVAAKTADRLDRALKVAAELIDGPELAAEFHASQVVELDVITQHTVVQAFPGMEIAHLGLVDEALEVSEFALVEDASGLFEIVDERFRIRDDADPARLKNGVFEVVIAAGDVTGRIMADRIRLVCGA